MKAEGVSMPNHGVCMCVCVHACMHAHVCVLLVGPWWSVLGERVVPVAWTNAWEMRYKPACTLSRQHPALLCQ